MGKVAALHSSNARVLPREFYVRPAKSVARDLLGKNLVSSSGGMLTAGQIVETEAYLPMDDPACHAARGKTPGNASMFGPAGFAYVYPIHSRHCFNAVVQNPDEGTAVLIRAVRPICGIATMMKRRLTGKPVDLCRGPARLCQALAIDRTCDGHDLTTGKRLWIDSLDAVDYPEHQIKVTERIGVTSAGHLPLRFVVRDCRYASGPRRSR